MARIYGLFGTYHGVVCVHEVDITAYDIWSAFWFVQARECFDVLNQMVCHPEPHVFKVAAGLGRDVHHQARCSAVAVDAARHGRALGRVQFGSGRSADADMTF